MGKKRGFWAEIQHQAAVAERERQRALAAAEREANRQVREAEQRRARAERARVAAIKLQGREKAAAEREAKRLHAEAQQLIVEARNAKVEADLADIDSVLQSTLEVDDHVDLEALRIEAVHPSFNSRFQAPIPAPPRLTPPPAPELDEPAAPTGIGGLFGKKKHAVAVEEARAEHARALQLWQGEVDALPGQQQQLDDAHASAEAERMASLAAARQVYDEECRARQDDVDARNARLDALIAAYDAGDQAAVEEYFSIVFGNSVYPETLSIEIDQTYLPEDRELEIALSLPTPADVPAVRAYKYTKAKDEITQTALTQKEQRERYNNLVHEIVLRTLHEVWESDRHGHVETINLKAGVGHIDPATGRETTTPLVAVAADRATFTEIDLARVTPAETLKHLAAVVSKNPFALTPIVMNDGVRG
ncbi:hypothetical protein [Nocardioides aequoreus]|uniref:hypothetical protein n=1 Tax=Nocardioides aequoreus TaxID=397278 RepID=UPI0004C3947B|nr:hypothetical protein [Nocardioides aequoreus]